MNVQVRYYTRSGNTRKLAEAIGRTVKAGVQDVAVPLNEKADVLFWDAHTMPSMLLMKSRHS